VNLDVHHPQSGFIDFEPCEVHDLLSGGHYVWSSNRNYVELSPHTLPAHVFKVTPK
jgi:starch synthase (maltosyl-transferring)